MAASKKKTSPAARKGKNGKNAPQQNTTIIEMIGYGIICIAVVSLIVLLSMHDPNNAIVSLMRGLAGNLCYVLPFILLWIGLIVTFFRTRQRDVGKITMIAGIILVVFSLAHIAHADEILGRLQLGSGWMNFIEQSYTERVGGGAIGALLTYPVYMFGGLWGGIAILVFILIGLIILISQFSLSKLGERAQDYLQSNYNAYRENHSARSAERAIQRAERRQAAEEERAARRQEAQNWNDSWDEPVLSGKSSARLAKNSADASYRSAASPADGSDNPLPRRNSALEVPDFLKDGGKKRKKPVFGVAQAADSDIQTEVASPFRNKGSKLVAELADPIPDEDLRSEYEEVLDSSFENDPDQNVSDSEDSFTDDGYFFEEPQEPEIPEPASFVYPDDLQPQEDGDSDNYEEEPQDIPVSSATFPPFDPDELEAPVQRERRRGVLTEPVKNDSPAKKKYAPDDYVPLSEDEFYNNPWNPEPGKRLDHTPLVVPPKHKGSIPEEDGKDYNYPPVDLLSLPRQHKEADRESKDQEKAAKLEATLHDFGINAKLTGIAHGPAVTRFELAPAPGVKVSRITSLSDDIALSLAALSVRIEAPIPGKAAVGVEIPNETVETVPLREVLESTEARKHPSRLAVGMGKDNSGKCIVGDIAKMPHVLIAGATGSGKSVCINCIICSILYRATPEEVRLIMIDPKMVELSIYNGIPHLLVPVVTDPKKASGALQWAVAEMTDRYNKFADRRVRDMKGYNLSLKEGEKPLPQIVIIIDELADLMMVCPGEVEDSICRLAQLARAAGIHLVIATQRPSVNVITGVIKANIPARIAFTVASSVDSRTILDVGGAEKLLGRGDMLFAPSGSNKMQRVQGAWVSDDEVRTIVEYIKERHDVEYSEDIIQHMNKAEETADAGNDDEQPAEYDELLPQAVEIAVEAGQASISMLQRRLRIGYARAGRLIDEMAARGIVSQSEGAKPRNVLITREQYNLMFNNAPID